MNDVLKKVWTYLKKDTWDAWLVSLCLIIIGIKFIFFPLLSIITQAPLPLVVIESCSKYHNANFDNWWERNAVWYESKNITLEDFKEFNLKNGLNKGDIAFVWGRGTISKGDVIIFNAQIRHPIIHRVVSEHPLGTKGDNEMTNSDQLQSEKDIPSDAVIGKAVARVPLLGWVKLIFFEPLRPKHERGLC